MRLRIMELVGWKRESAFKWNAERDDERDVRFFGGGARDRAFRFEIAVVAPLAKLVGGLRQVGRRCGIVLRHLVVTDRMGLDGLLGGLH